MAHKASGKQTHARTHDTRNWISQSDSDWSFLAVSSPKKEVTGSH